MMFLRLFGQLGFVGTGVAMCLLVQSSVLTLDVADGASQDDEVSRDSVPLWPEGLLDHIGVAADSESVYTDVRSVSTGVGVGQADWEQSMGIAGRSVLRVAVLRVAVFRGVFFCFLLSLCSFSFCVSFSFVLRCGRTCC